MPPRKKYTKEEIAQAEEYAFQGCLTGTICELMGWDKCTVDQRKDIKKKLTKKRAERKAWLRKLQMATAEDTASGKASATMQIFLGKNVLGQADKQETKHGVTTTLADFLRDMTKDV